MSFENELIKKISTGNAVLFTGAGFSLDSVSVTGKNPIKASDLSKLICRLCDIDEDDDLGYSAEYSISNNKSDLLISLLKDYFLIKYVSDESNIICSIKWRRIYTTNYDDTLEIAFKNAGKKYQTVGIDSEISKYIRNDNLCVHLNGYIGNVTVDSLDDTFKLSNSSYASFTLSDAQNWDYFFHNDLRLCSAIVFVGYSLYDFDIKRILHLNPELKEKTFFITVSEPSTKDLFQLNRYGKVLTIEKKGFAELIKNNKEQFESSERTLFYKSFSKYDLQDEIENEVRDVDIENFLLFGIKQDFIVSKILQKDGFFAVNRQEKIESVLSFFADDKNIVISASFGNGKSCLLYQIATKLVQRSNEVYFLKNENTDFIEDIKSLSNNGLYDKYVIIDDALSNLDFFKDFFIVAPSNIHFITSCRDDQRSKQILFDLMPNETTNFIVLNSYLPQNKQVQDKISLLQKYLSDSIFFLIHKQ